MDHAKSYAMHIAAAIRHKRAMAKEPKEEPVSDTDELEPFGDSEELDAPADPKAARKERLKAILAR